MLLPGKTASWACAAVPGCSHMRKAPATAPEIHTNTAPVRDSAAGGQLLCICLYPWIEHNPAAPRATGVESHPQQLTFGTCRASRRCVG